jgi:hypothetical protein
VSENIADKMERQKVLLNIFKMSFGFALVGLFIYWTCVAVQKFIDQPTTTVLSYTKGDNDFKVTFPHMTLCPSSTIIKTHPELMNCRGNSSEFFAAIFNCLKSNPKLDIDQFWKSIELNISDLITKVTLAYEPNINQQIIMDHEKFVYTKFHSQFGPCVGLSLGDLEFTINDFGRILVKLNNTSFDKWVLLMLHTPFDSPDAFYGIQPITWINPNDPTSSRRAYLKKKLIDRQSTRKSPCKEYHTKTCLEVEGTRKVAEVFKCKIPFLYGGKHLDKFVENYWKLQDCQQDVLVDALDLFLNNQSGNCNVSLRPCKTSRYSMSLAETT